MLEKIKNINPKSLTDFAQLQELVTMLFNVVESQAAVLEEVRQENQELRNEINRLKGEHGDLPPKPPKSTSTTTTINRKPKPKTNKNNKKGGKKTKLEIDRIVDCKLDKTTLPPDAKFQGYRTVVQQDLIIKRDNVLFKIPVYYSPKERKTYRGKLPPEYEGEFGGQLKSWLQLLHHYCDVTQGRLKHLMDNLDLDISTGSINNILLSNADVMIKESAAILRSGLEHISYTQSDGTKGWEAGQGKSTQIICTPYYSIYHTMSSKSKANIILALQGKTGNCIPLIYDKLAVSLLANSIVPKKDQKLLSQLLTFDQRYDLEEFESILKEEASHLLEKNAYPKMQECLALAYYLRQTDFPKVQHFITDAGPEYIGIGVDQSLCWLHEERHYKKMIPKLRVNQTAVDDVRKQIWDFYKKLLNFKELPPDQQSKTKQKLDQEFDDIFTQKTDYDALNDRIEKTFSKKTKLLLVLDFPQIPLHNNTAELAVRRKVRKRDISLHTMSVKGTQAQDAFMSVVETAAKLGVNALEYLHDRISKKYLLPSLAETLRITALSF